MQNRMLKSPYGIYVEYLRKGELAYQIASDGTPVFFPRIMAPGSGDTALEWRLSKGIGTVYATTAIQLKNESALNVALVDLDEGYRMMSRVEGIPADQVKIGARVKVKILEAVGDDPPVPVFVPLEQSGA